ncbi:hypothetical protein PULV_a3224 [Pseudoalteromonas ulvae UL12]|uniref:L-lysine 2,3-aminomutase n=1 Tax=Pseudoalteromonas ulvae TaxID=107327 RepID=A0A244CPF3_PSEDV|nr:EF-P beta-lysylation protein EpmB [Pseudoalteromonas ulvae]MBE0364932.1 hypothetical protein [Pseudoalteromonas ulvae UL12]OUL57501.1 EF-P beta-lysylation protein EpmB [Pseudoalteromonas ulvae]
MIQTIEANLHTDWQKELSLAVSEPKKLLEMLNIDSNLYVEDAEARSLFAMRVPLPFIAKMQKGNFNDPLLQQVLPLRQEFLKKAGYSSDPLKEQKNEVPGLLHKYSSRVLIIFRTGCAVNCRYCFRRHFPYQDNHLNKRAMQEPLAYIAAHPQINEVILSGGDPLMANDEQLNWFVEQLEKIQTVTRLRIHTRLPVVIPNRITETLCQILKKTRLKTIMVTHINHANEIDKALSDKIRQLKSAGVTLLNQAVLLKGINDTTAAQVALSEALFEADILPYYLHLLDKVEGASHFEISDEQAKQLMIDVLNQLPGFLVPKLVRELGGEKSKTPIDLGL